jgi:hypothetical protein
MTLDLFSIIWLIGWLVRFEVVVVVVVVVVYVGFLGLFLLVYTVSIIHPLLQYLETYGRYDMI